MDKDNDLWLTIFHICGYILAVPPLFFITPALLNKKKKWPGSGLLVAELLGTLIIITGWVFRSNIIAIAINSSWLLFFSWAWWRRQQKGA